MSRSPTPLDVDSASAESNPQRQEVEAQLFLRRNVAKLSESELEKNRRGSSSDEKAAAAAEFAVDIVSARGAVPADAVETVRAAGYDEAEIVEIVAHVALNTLTNYMNEALDTEIDFPEALPLVNPILLS